MPGLALFFHVIVLCSAALNTCLLEFPLHGVIGLYFVSSRCGAQEVASVNSVQCRAL